jgi:RHS repeat-associated protein
VSALVSATNGAVTATYEYGPFGELTRATGQASKLNEVMYQSQICDWESGKYYWKHRYYDTSTGRWLNHDPIGERGGLNLYGFVGNNPVNRIDPYGMDYHYYEYSSSLPPGINPLICGDTAFEQMVAHVNNFGTELRNGVVALGYGIDWLAELAFGHDGPGFVQAELPGLGMLGDLEGLEAEAANLRGAANTVAKCPKQITVIGAGRDVARYVGKPGFNTFTGEGIALADLDRENALWLNSAILNGDEIWLLTDPAAHQALMDLKGLQSAYLNLELPMLSQYTEVNAIPKFVPSIPAGVP